MRNKLMALALVVVLGLAGGCGCKRTDPVTGATTTTLKNCVTAVQTQLCSGSDTQKSQAATLSQFIIDGAAFVGKVSIGSVTYENAILLLDDARNGTCVLLADLQKVIDYANSINAMIQGKSMAKGMKAVIAPPVMPNIDALRAAVK